MSSHDANLRYHHVKYREMEEGLEFGWNFVGTCT